MNKWAESPECTAPGCGAPVMDVEHVVLHCPHHTIARKALFVPPMTQMGLEVLARFPKRAVRFLRDIGMNSFPKLKTDRPEAPPALSTAGGQDLTSVARGWATRKLKEAKGEAPAKVKNPTLRPGYESRPNSNIKGEAFRAKLAAREKAKLEPSSERCRQCENKSLRMAHTRTGTCRLAQSGDPSAREVAAQGGGQCAAGGGRSASAPPPGRAETAQGGSPGGKRPQAPHTLH